MYRYFEERPEIRGLSAHWVGTAARCGASTIRAKTLFPRLVNQEFPYSCLHDYFRQLAIVAADSLMLDIRMTEIWPLNGAQVLDHLDSSLRKTTLAKAAIDQLRALFGVIFALMDILQVIDGLDRSISACAFFAV